MSDVTMGVVDDSAPVLFVRIEMHGYMVWDQTLDIGGHRAPGRRVLSN